MSLRLVASSFRPCLRRAGPPSFRTFHVAFAARPIPNSVLKHSTVLQSRNFWGRSNSPAKPVEDVAALTPEVPISDPAVETAAVDVPLPDVPLPDSAASVSASTPLPTPDLVPIDALDSIVSVIPPALQYGDLAALGLASGWTPAGWFRWTIELVQVSTGVNWVLAIVGATLIWRLVTLPIVLKTSRTAAKMKLIAPQLAKIDKDLAAKPEQAMYLNAQKMQVMKSVGVNPLTGLLGIVMLPMQIGMFLGVQKLCSGEVVQLMHSGLEWLPNLAASDPTYLLPILGGIMTRLSMTISIRTGDIDISNGGFVKRLITMMLPFTYITPLIFQNFSSGLMVYIITGSTWIICQSALLRSNIVRGVLRLPPHVGKPQQVPGIMDAVASFKEFTAEMALKTQEAQQQAQLSQRQKPRKGGK